MPKKLRKRRKASCLGEFSTLFFFFDYRINCPWWSSEISSSDESIPSRPGPTTSKGKCSLRFFNLIYLLILARTGLRHPLSAKGTRDSAIDLSDAVPNTPQPIQTPSSRTFLSLYLDDSDDQPATSSPLPVGNGSTSHSTSAINHIYSEEEYIVTDIELTDEVIAVLDKTYDGASAPPPLDVGNGFFTPADCAPTPHSTSAIEDGNSEDEYLVSDIELTEDVIAVLDQTYDNSFDQEEDEYAVPDIELSDELIALLDGS